MQHLLSPNRCLVQGLPTNLSHNHILSPYPIVDMKSSRLQHSIIIGNNNNNWVASIFQMAKETLNNNIKEFLKNSNLYSLKQGWKGLLQGPSSCTESMLFESIQAIVDNILKHFNILCNFVTVGSTSLEYVDNNKGDDDSPDFIFASGKSLPMY